MPYNYSGFVSISFKEVPYTLNICLSIADKGYIIETLVPSPNYEKDLYGKFDFLKQIAKAYWKQFSEE
jgi:hypothetical protein